MQAGKSNTSASFALSAVGNVRCAREFTAGLSFVPLRDTRKREMNTSNTLLSAGRRNPQELRPHPLNEEIYGDRTDADLIESIRTKGVLNPLLITSDGRIISGHRRWGAALAISLDAIPVVTFGSTDELDVEEALIESNRQRTKTNEQIGREYKHLTRIYNLRESKQGQRSDLTSVKDLTEVKKELRPTRKAAEKVGVSHETANKAGRVVDAIDKLESEGDAPSAEDLRKTLEHSVNGAYNKAKDAGVIPMPTPKPKPVRTFISVTEWQTANAARRAEWMFARHSSSQDFNKTNDNVEWALWTWNPVTGCLHNCAYCYARDIANRFFNHLPDGERFAPVFYPDRLAGPSNTKQPDYAAIEDPVRRMGLRNVFVCSMADLFGKWVPSEWIEAVLQQAWDNPQWNFLFLTKFPIRMAEFEYPPNTWIGTTVDTQYAVERAEKAFRKVRASGYEGIAWLSCEPMMERLTFSSLEMFDWVVMGGASRSTQTPEFRPPFEWIVHLWNQAKSLDLPIYMKTNLFVDDAHKNIEVSNRVREYPVRALK